MLQLALHHQAIGWRCDIWRRWCMWSPMRKAVTLRLPSQLLAALRSHSSGHTIGDFVTGALRMANLRTIEVPKLPDHVREATCIVLEVKVLSDLDAIAAERRLSRNALLTAALYATLSEHDTDIVEGLLRAALGKELRSARTDIGISVQTLAGLIGITPDDVERIEEGAGSPSIDTVWRWCRACERIPSDVLREAERRANIKNWD